jgi:enoyl-CoA hydratase
MQDVLIETVGRTRVVTINRPHVRNAVDRDAADQLHDAFVAFDADDELDVAILTGSAGAFCAGADLKGVSDGRGNRVVADMTVRGPMGPTRLRMSKPVIAAIEGHAVAGGLELAVWCDLRVAAADATLGVYCRRWGVPLVDGGTFRLARLIGQSRAMDLVLTGRGVGAEEALAMGLVNRVAPIGQALATAITLAAELSKFPQRCLRSDRQSLMDQWSLDEDAALLHETELGLATIRSGETQEGARRFAEGRGRSGSFSDL